MSNKHITLISIVYLLIAILSYGTGYKSGYITGTIEGEEKYFQPYLKCLLGK